jgi:predicted nucleotidyltransferase
VLQQMTPELPVEQLASPNNILGLEYLRALGRQKSSIKPFTVPRLGPGYHDTDAVGRIASATGIRRMLAEDEAVDEYLPGPCHAMFHEARQAGLELDPGKLFTALQGRLLQEPASLAGVYQVEHGLAHRLTDAAQQANEYAGLTAAVKSRHWTLTRIQRILAYVLLQVSKVEMDRFLESGPLYLRLLGMGATGQRCLADARSIRTLPIVADPSRGANVLRKFYGEGTEQMKIAGAMLALDLRATRIYTALMKSPEAGHRNRDFFEPVRRGSQKQG